MESSCGWICNPTIVWLDEFAVVKILDRIKKPTGCPRFDPVFGSHNNPLFGSLSIMITSEHSIFVGWRVLFQNPECMNRTYWRTWCLYYSPGADVVFDVGILMSMYYCCRTSWVLMVEGAQWSMTYCLHWMMVLTRHVSSPSLPSLLSSLSPPFCNPNAPWLSQPKDMRCIYVIHQPLSYGCRVTPVDIHCIWFWVSQSEGTRCIYVIHQSLNYGCRVTPVDMYFIWFWFSQSERMRCIYVIHYPSYGCRVTPVDMHFIWFWFSQKKTWGTFMSYTSPWVMGAELYP